MNIMDDAPKGLELTAKGPLVLLFYDGYERYARPGFGGAIYSHARRFARYSYRLLRRRQLRTGFYTAFLSLHRSLKLLGCDVRINDFAAAAARPGYPIGLCGFPSVLSQVDLPNPVIFGHGDIGYPEQAKLVAQQDRMRILIQPCAWARDFNIPYCGNDKLRVWPVGVDVDAFSPSRIEDKNLDFLVYDKIRWHRSERVPRVLDKIVDQLMACGRSVKRLRYGGHIQSDYYRELKRAKALLFLCEHETQGIAYQEAMAAGVPVLAWDEGALVDTNLIPFASPNLIVSSVPYFDERCGMRFTMDNFDAVYPAFWQQLESFRPREYVSERLSMMRAAQDYLALYSSITGPRKP
jgi:hypothetical protein